MNTRSSSTANRPALPFTIGENHVDPASLRITRPDKTVKLEPKAMSVLIYLSAHSATAVSRQQLEEAVWPGSVVGYDALSNAIIKIRKALGDNARQPKYIETVSKFGYRIIADVKPDAEGSSLPSVGDMSHSGAHASIRDEDHLVLPDKPSIAVLAFENLSGETDQEYFSDGITEDIITDLSKLSGLFVIARNSSFRYKDGNVDPKEISRELGVRYLLEGSVRKSGDRIRISTRLIDGSNGIQIWGERYDRDLTDIFAVQDEVTRAIVSALEPTLKEQEQTGAIRPPTDRLDAYDYFLRGRDQALRDTRETNLQAYELLETAIELDPNFSLAHSHLARNIVIAYVNSWGSTDMQSLDRAMTLTRHALELDSANPHGYFVLAATAIWMKNHELADREARRAIRIGPSFADAHAVHGLVLMYSGLPNEALERLAFARRLDPHYRDIYLHIQAQALVQLEAFEDAAEILRKRLVRKPESDISRVLLSSVYGHLGDTTNSRTQWEEAVRCNPGYSIEHRRKVLPYRRHTDFDQIVEGLHKGGVLT